MSYLVFGSFSLENLTERHHLTRIAFDVVALALTEHLHVQLGHNVVHPDLIFEMLHIAKNDDFLNRMPFLITGSPLEDGSDTLISPYHVGLGSDSSSLLVNLARVGRFLVALRAVRSISSIEVLFSEGFDDRFHEVVVSPEVFSDAAAALFCPIPEIPSTRFVVSLS